MSAVVGIDLSSKAIDLVKLSEDDNRADWVRCELTGKNAWERTLRVRDALLLPLPGSRIKSSLWWDDVYMVAIEAPYGSGQAGTQAILNRVVGAVAASLPAHLRVPERCWVVRPDEWKTGLGLKGKPTLEEYARLACSGLPYPHETIVVADPGAHPEGLPHGQNARDAYCLAMFARDSNRKAIEAAA